MSTYCTLTLPVDVRCRDLGTVMAALAGKGIKLKTIVGSHPYVVAEPDVEVTVKNSSVVACVDIGMKDGPHAFFQLESFHRGRRGVMFYCDALHAALAVGLARFFGGTVDIRDDDDVDVDYKFEKQYRNDPTDGGAWTRHQRRMANVKPITAEEVQSFVDRTRYQDWTASWGPNVAPKGDE